MEFHHAAAEVIEHLDSAAPVGDVIAGHWSLPVGHGDEMNPPSEIAQQACDFFQGRHGNETIDAEVGGCFEPDFAMSGGEEVAVEVDDAASHLGPGHGGVEINAGQIVLRRRRDWR